MTRWVSSSLSAVLAMLVCGCSAASEEVPKLQAMDVSEFIVNADEDAALHFLADAKLCSQGIPYVVRDYSNAEVGKGVARCGPGVTAMNVSLKLHRGYHEIQFPEAYASFGVMAMDRVDASLSGFFGVDAAFSYLESSTENRTQFVAQLKRLGVGAVRDRINWIELHPSQAGWNGAASHQFDDMRKVYAGGGIKVVDVLQALPVDQGNYFPADAELVAPVSRIAVHWGDVWDGVEIANEPDHNRIYDHLSSEQKVSYQKQYAGYAAMVAKDIKQSKPDSRIVGGAFAYALAGGKLDSSRFADGVAAAGLLQSVDVISFHTYADAKGLRRDIGSFRDWLKRSGVPDMPLWITESGWPWKRGPARPPLDQDQDSALQIAGKAVVAYAMGVERFYSFVYPYYEENEKNFGMTGKERTPLRSLAAYVQAGKVLSGARVLSLVGDMPDAGLGAIFETRCGIVMVVLHEHAGIARAAVHVPFPVVRAEGIDGRPLPVKDGDVPLVDGLAYIWISDADVSAAKGMLGKAK